MNPSDIQGLVFHSYRRFPHASYALLRFGTSPAAAQRWLADFVQHDRVDCASPKEVGPVGSPEIRLNIALTYSGLLALGRLDDDTLTTFPAEFVEGLGVPWGDPDTPDHRSRVLGDVGDSRPAAWNWGYQDSDRRVDVLLLGFARDAVHLNEQIKAWIGAGVAGGAIAGGLTLSGRLPRDPAQPNREPFGFVDGISQPLLKGASSRRRGMYAPQPAIQEVDDGELLMGYRDGTRQIAQGPTVRAALDLANVLPVALSDSGRHDLGFNGTYLVFRQLAQDVKRFADACHDGAQALGLSEDHVAALVVGRWRDGSPLISAPVAPNPHLSKAPAANDFTYRHDPHGERCPMGAHIRRANPRDSLGDDPANSLRIVNRHRILRRGRLYESGSGERGLHFIGLNASISRQFEFIQQNWINDATFGGLCGEDDPLIGSRQPPADASDYTVPPPPENRVSRRLPHLRRFVTVRGAGYFFLPSLSALRYLSNAAPAPASAPAWRPAPTLPTTADRIRLLVLARFPIISALLLAVAPLGILSSTAGPLVRPTFDLDHPWEMLIVTALASLAAAGASLTFRVTQLYARPRFGVNVIVPPLTWRTFFTWQALSLPIVVTALWRSAADAALVSASRLRTSAWFGGAAISGYVLAFAVLYIASAARGASVRPENPEDAVLLPLTRRLARLKRRHSVIATLAKPFVDFFESRAALLSESAGVGYVDHNTGQFLPGHLAAALFVITLALVYALGWCLLRPPVAFQLPPLAYFLFIVLVMGLWAAAAAFFLDRFRVPLLLAILGWFVFATFIGGSDHEFEVHGDLNSPVGVADSIARADGFNRDHRGHADAAIRPIVVVAAGGGGIRQAMWTTQVLTGLTALWGERFSENLRLVSAVSAGSVGALPYLNGYTDDRAPVGDLQAMVRASAESASGDIWWGLTYPDSLRALFSFPPKPLFNRTRDRGWALEKAWERNFGFGDHAPTLGSWRRDVGKGWRPAAAFNATIVETGCRAVFATYELPGRLSPNECGTSQTREAGNVSVEDGAQVDAAAVAKHDISVVTVARLSAAFPYVTPVARLGDNPDADSMVHIADGGYWDNSGVVSTLEWLREAQDALRDRDVLVIQIAPAPLGETVIHDRAWVWQQTAPLSGLLSVRTAAQRARNAIEIDLLRKAWSGKSITFATIADTGTHVSLGWHLSRRERSDVEGIWRCRYVDPKDGQKNPELMKIESILGPRPSRDGEPGKGCRQ